MFIFYMYSLLIALALTSYSYVTIKHFFECKKLEKVEVEKVKEVETEDFFNFDTIYYGSEKAVKVEKKDTSFRDVFYFSVFKIEVKI